MQGDKQRFQREAPARKLRQNAINVSINPNSIFHGSSVDFWDNNDVEDDGSLSDMTTITFKMMAISITINTKIMMAITIIHQMDRSKFDGIHRHHPSLYISIWPKKFKCRIFFLNSWNIIYTKSIWLQLQSWKEPQLMFLGICFEKNPLFEGFLLDWWWWRYYQKFDGPSLHPIKLKNVMAIKAFCEKLMAITDGPSMMDHHRHVLLW